MFVLIEKQTSFASVQKPPFLKKVYTKYIQTRLIKPGIETTARACLDLPQVDRNKSHLTWASAAGETLLYLHPSPRQVRCQNLKNNTMVLKYLLSKNKAVHLYYNLKRKRKKRASINVLTPCKYRWFTFWTITKISSVIRELWIR